MNQVTMIPARVRIASELRKAIYAGEFKDGDELSLTKVAELLGISRTPVREAFQELEAEGLITLRMNKGAIVNRVDRKFVQDIFEVRSMLESEAAAQAAKRGMETEQLLERSYDFRDHFNEMDRETYETLNQDIHITIWKAADNHQLQKYLLEMWNGPSITGTQEEVSEHYRDSTFEHIAVLQFIRDGKETEARKAMEQHIIRSMQNMLRLFPGT